jgi:hypothetical protein
MALWSPTPVSEAAGRAAPWVALTHQKASNR